MNNLFNHAYPYLDEHELNLDWLIAKMKELNIKFDEFKVVNSITFSGQWDITKQYPAWTIVSDNNIGYISIVPVPAGVVLTDGNYWKAVIDYSAQIADLQQRVINCENDIDNIENNIIPPLTSAVDDVKSAIDKKLFAPSNIVNYYGYWKTGKAQGMCVDPNGNIYLAQATDNVNNTLWKFDMQDGLTSTTANLALYHGNDMCFINNKLYVAPFSDASGTWYANNNICVVDLATMTVTDNGLLSTLPGGLCGIAKKDDEHIICLVVTGQFYTDWKLYEVDIVNNTYEEITINVNKIIDYYTYIQSIEYANGVLYVQIYANNGLLCFDYKEGNADYIGSIIFGDSFDNGISFGELEGISLLPDSYGFNFLITSHKQAGTCFGSYSPNGLGIKNKIQIHGNLINVNASGTKLREDTGSTTYPFKDLYNAMEAISTCKGEMLPVINAYNGTYTLPDNLYNMNCIIQLGTGANDVTINNGGTAFAYNCNIIFNGDGGDNTKLKVSIRFNSVSSILRYLAVKFPGVYAVVSSDIYVSNAYITDTISADGCQNVHGEVTASDVSTHYRVTAGCILHAFGSYTQSANINRTANCFVTLQGAVI